MGACRKGVDLLRSGQPIGESFTRDGCSWKQTGLIPIARFRCTCMLPTVHVGTAAGRPHPGTHERDLWIGVYVLALLL